VALEVLHLVRHSVAETQHADGDRFRALTAEGQRRLQDLLIRVRSYGALVDWALASPYRRAVQTRQACLDVLGQPRTAESPVWTPDADVGEAEIELRAWQDQGVRRLAIFTHNPLVTELASALVAPGTWPRLEFHAPTWLALAFDHGVAWGQGRVLWMVHP